MKKMKVLMCREVSLPTTAGDWQLYTSMPGVGNAAKRLTKALKKAIREPKREDAAKIMDDALHVDVDFGACDSEPWYVCHRILDKVYPRNM